MRSLVLFEDKYAGAAFDLPRMYGLVVRSQKAKVSTGDQQDSSIPLHCRSMCHTIYSFFSIRPAYPVNSTWPWPLIAWPRSVPSTATAPSQ